MLAPRPSARLEPSSLVAGGASRGRLGAPSSLSSTFEDTWGLTILLLRRGLGSSAATRAAPVALGNPAAAVNGRDKADELAFGFRACRTVSPLDPPAGETGRSLRPTFLGGKLEPPGTTLGGESRPAAYPPSRPGLAALIYDDGRIRLEFGLLSNGLDVVECKRDDGASAR
jgi:hypothetical protein